MRRPSTQTDPGLVSKFENTAYDKVAVVSDNIDAVVIVADNLEVSLIYLGAAGVHPDTRLDGTPIQSGDYYLDTDSDSLVYYNGSNDTWVEVDPTEVLNARDIAVLKAEEARLSALAATSSETASADSAEEAEGYATSAQASVTVISDLKDAVDLSVTAASDSADASATSATQASGSATSAQTSATSASDSADAAEGFSALAETAKTSATASATSAATSVTSAEAEAVKAMASETAAGTSATSASASAVTAKAEADRAEDIADSIAIRAMPKATFDAQKEERKRTYAGSGSVEWGKHTNSSSASQFLENINQGLWTWGAEVTFANTMRWGRFGSAFSTALGTSRTGEPIVMADGVQLVIINTGPTGTENIIKFPPAPDGTKAYDSSTGIVTQYADSATAFAAETTTNKVITSRKDLVLLETWHEVISNKGVIYPFGNTQCGLLTFEGITLQDDNIAQGYSAFGEWDTDTKGYSAVWDNLTFEQQCILLDNPENNIYYDSGAGELIQVRYRIRVIEGKGDLFNEMMPIGGLSLTYTAVGGAENYIKVQAGSTISLDYGPYYSDGGYFISDTHAWYSGDESRTGEWVAIKGNGVVTPNAHNGLCTALSIALVQRLNQGGYHPTYNQGGTSRLTNLSGSASGSWWDKAAIGSTHINSASDCFTYSNGDGGIGGPALGRSDQYSYHDAIYAGQVGDLRLNANKQDYNRVLEGAVRRGLNGVIRGKDKVPFTYSLKSVQQSTNLGSDAVHLPLNFISDKGVNGTFLGGKFSVLDASGAFLMKDALITREGTTGAFDYVIGDLYDGSYDRVTGEELTIVISTLMEQEFDSLPWIDIIGTPERIAATFPDGVAGQWVPSVPDGITKDYDFNRKATGNFATHLYTSNDGRGWTFHNTNFIDSVTNARNFGADTSGVGLYMYEALSKFTESDINLPVVGDLRDVFVANDYSNERGNRLSASLVGVINKNDTYGERDLNLTTLTYSLVSPTNKLRAVPSPKHHPIPFGAPTNGSHSVKALPHLVEKDGLLYVQWHGTELVYGAGWGDDDEIAIVDAESTKTDINGATVKVVTHTEQIPVGIADHTQSI